MSGFSKEMQDALRADGEKLQAETGEDHGPRFEDLIDTDYEADDGCSNCGGEGFVYSCVDEIGCLDPEGGCDLCMRRCDWCNTPQGSAS